MTLNGHFSRPAETDPYAHGYDMHRDLTKIVQLVKRLKIRFIFVTLVEMQFKAQCYLHFYLFQEKFTLSNHSLYFKGRPLKEKCRKLLPKVPEMTVTDKDIVMYFKNDHLI